MVSSKGKVNWACAVLRYMNGVKVLKKNKGHMWVKNDAHRYYLGPMGSNSFSMIARDCAVYLELDDVEKFTFQSFRR